MIRISIGYFQELGGALKPLEAIVAATKIGNCLGPIYTAKDKLSHLLTAEWFAPAIKSSSPPGQALMAVLDRIALREDYEAEMGYLEWINLSSAMSDFMGALKAELAVADAYFVSRKGGYDTGALIWAPESLFPADLGGKVPLAMPDVRDAAKALAFELCTASGFHVLRATEAVLREYWTATSGGKDHPEERNMGVYLREMDKHKFGSDKVKSVLRQIKDLHRNPLMHPEDRLDIDSAVDLFGIARSAIGAMLREIPQPTGALNQAAGLLAS